MCAISMRFLFQCFVFWNISHGFQDVVFMVVGKACVEHRLRLSHACDSINPSPCVVSSIYVDVWHSVVLLIPVNPSLDSASCPFHMLKLLWLHFILVASLCSCLFRRCICKPISMSILSTCILELQLCRSRGYRICFWCAMKHTCKCFCVHACRRCLCASARVAGWL